MVDCASSVVPACLNEMLVDKEQCKTQTRGTYGTLKGGKFLLLCPPILLYFFGGLRARILQPLYPVCETYQNWDERTSDHRSGR